MKFLFFLLLCQISLVTAGIFSMTMHKVDTGEKSITNNLRRKKFANLASGNQPITGYYNSVYVANITIGTPAQTFTMLLDTSSSIFFVPSISCHTKGCTSAPGIPAKNLFDSSKSSTFFDEGIPSSGYYGYGQLSDDVVSIAPGLSANKQRFTLAETLQDYLQNNPYDGIFGLGWQHDGTPALQNFLPALDKPIFTIFYVLQASDAMISGKITYGALDTVHCSSAVNYVPHNTQLYNMWSFVFRGFAVGTYTDSVQYQAVIDSGYQGIGVPPNPYNAIMKQIGAFEGKFGGMVVLCANIPKLPDLVLIINGINYRIPAKQYVLPNDTGSPNCQVTVSNTFDDETWMLGDVWLRSFCTTFDMSNKQIGFSNVNRN